MSKFTVSTKINYPIKEVFNSFINISKKDFNKFNVENPLGAKYKRIIKKSKNINIYMENEITDYKINHAYEVTGRVANSTYVSRFEFKAKDDNTTEIFLNESQQLYGIINKIAFALQLVTVRKKLKRKINNTVKILEESIIKNKDCGI